MASDHVLALLAQVEAAHAKLHVQTGKESTMGQCCSRLSKQIQALNKAIDMHIVLAGKYHNTLMSVYCCANV